jgi:DNA-binding MarR family transcriptional regulator
MSNRRTNRAPLPYETTIKVRDNCLCLHLQRAARAVARHFDELMRPTGLTSGQFSLLMSLNRPDPPTMRAVAELLAMDRTTLTANLKPLERRGFLRVRIDRKDRRSRRLVLSAKGRLALTAALPAWEEGHALIEPALAGRNANRLRADLRALA